MASSSMLQGLPVEIKLNICSQFAIDGVDVSDGFHSLTALRLTCRAFEYLPTEKIIKVVKIFLSNETLHALEWIAQQPEYSPCTRHEKTGPRRRALCSRGYEGSCGL